jgi:hypothetical protein
MENQKMIGVNVDGYATIELFGNIRKRRLYRLILFLNTYFS